MRLFSKVYPHWVFWTVPERVWAPKPCSFDWCDRSVPRSGVVCLAGPGLVVRGRPESGSGGLGRGTHVVWALTAPEHGTSDTCSLIAWTIDLLSNILREGRLLQHLKQLKIINHRVNKTIHCAEREHFSATFTCYRKCPFSHLWSHDYELPAFKLLVFCWKNNVIFHCLITINSYMQKICAVFHVKCEEWQVGCHRLFFWVYRCNFHFNFTQCTMILLS